MRPDRVVVIVGTGTEVGKTWVTCRVAGELRRRGLVVSARKPAQSFDPEPPAGSTDAELLAAATGEPPEAVCPRHRWYEVAMAPPMAAEVLASSAITLAELVAELGWAAAGDASAPPAAVGLLETAGGVRSPLAHDGDAVDLANLVQPDHVLLVADARLGALNAVRLAAAPFADHRLVVFLNRFDERDDLQRRNRSWLVERYGFAVETAIPALASRFSP